MSIPPLVCSTPPPPDQCEDDKDPEDFDLSYNLSQEDEDDAYNYGNFSSLHFQSISANNPIEIKEQEMTKNIEVDVPKDVILNYGTEKESDQNIHPSPLQTNDINENKLKCEEDMNIEDLNLKIDEEVESIVESSTERNEIISEHNNIESVKDSDIPCNSSNSSPSYDNTNVSSIDENVVDSTNQIKNFDPDFVEREKAHISESMITIAHNVNDTDIFAVQSDVTSNTCNLDDPLKLEDTLIGSQDEPQLFEQSSKNLEPCTTENVIDDDFGDFDDFQSVNTKNNITSVVESSGNPWDTANSNDSDFGSFTANFEENILHVTDDKSATENVFLKNNENTVDCESYEISNCLGDDDFGDFDDFKSSSVKTESTEFAAESHSQSQELPVLNLQSTENEQQIMESISKVLSSVFLEEVTEPEGEFEAKLESLLSETWGHLMETDERQPYIVNWNNSLGQKTLLRALCIDSRNILFGPKWSSSMPKYAANLSTAPLQPQKQASTVPSSTVVQNETVAEKSSSKPTTWTDPFTSDGQESCNTENEAAVKPSAPDLDVFEAAVSTKSDKIYSNTIGVQPLRQINLPDTHIFTPTDSEIPRSKTIHYDRAPAVVMSQSSTAESQKQTDTVISSSTDIVQNNVDDNEYWEFQNFKSTSDTSFFPGSTNQPDSNNQEVISHEKSLESATTINALPKPNIAYQTELLQPIRVEPAMPTLNWPDPGEVKGVFDDFTDFVSISTQQTEIPNSSSIQSPEINLENNKLDLHEKLKTFGEVEAAKTIVKSDNDGFDDDFDTFQSALPSSNKINPSAELGNGSPKSDSNKSDAISFASIPRPNEALTQSIGYISNTTELTDKLSSPSGTHLQSNLLQPTPATFSAVNTQSQQKSGQILQPLSLESYSQINWPSPGIDLQDLSRFNPVETLHSLKSDLSVSGLNKAASPIHAAKNTVVNQSPDDDGWGEFVSSKPKQQPQSQPKKPSVFVDDDEWTDFISSPTVKPQNGLNTISLNVHTNSNIQKSVQNKYAKKSNQPPLDIPTLNYITPKSNQHRSYNDKHFQNL